MYYRITISVDDLRMDEERSARERRITLWTGALPVLLVLGTLTLVDQVLVRCLVDESRDGAWWTSLLQACCDGDGNDVRNDVARTLGSHVPGSVTLLNLYV